MGRFAISALMLLALVALVMPIGGGLHAQVPPSAHDLEIYAGLHAAAARGDVAEIEQLIAQGERIDIQDSNSRTPLLVAAYRKQYEAMRTLLRLQTRRTCRTLTFSPSPPSTATGRC